MIERGAILHRLALAVRRALLIAALVLATASTAQAHTLATARYSIDSVSAMVPSRSKMIASGSTVA